jgi:hypothetical protein
MKKLDLASETIIARFEVYVSSKAEKVDPDGERDWFDLAYGYCLGAGMGPRSAMKLALEIQERGLL